MSSNESQTFKLIDLNQLRSPGFGLTPNLGGTLAEAASVCLDSQSHSLEVELHQFGEFSEANVKITRLEVTEEMVNSHRDGDKATWDGAEGVAILLMMEVGPGEKFARARKAGKDRKEGGFDYWFVEDAGPTSVFEDPTAGRLEVAGRRCETERNMELLLDDKIEQTEKSDEHYGDRLTYAIVVEFGKPQARVRQR